MLTFSPWRLTAGAFIAGLTGCGGGGGGSASTAPVVTASVGVMLDSPVHGLHYATATQRGTTDAAGAFKYLPGESIVFSIGNIQLPATTARAVLTPLDLASTTNIADQRVSNMLVLLQSLDSDGNPANGIAFPTTAALSAPSGVDFNVPPSVFRASTALGAFIANATGAGRTLVTEADARLHFQNSLNIGTNNSKINIAPFSEVSANQRVALGVAVNLDGANSSDANGDSLTFEWSVVSKPTGSAAALSYAKTARASLLPDVAGEYVVGLVVRDGVLSSPVALTQVSVASGSPVPTGYRLVWSDEFDTAGAQLPDTSKWAYDTSRNSAGWYNNELQYYANGRMQNSVVQSGNLLITPRKESLAGNVNDWGGQSYTSARLVTKGKASWTYGFFDIRAKLPCGAGTWPAIWTLGSTTDTWPDQGEIDIMEQTGWDKSTVLGSVHTLAGFGGNASTGSTGLADACTAFHNYQIKWTASSIDFYVDGVPFRSAYAKPSTSAGWPFDKPQYLILNVAVGGVLGGTVNDATLSATGMEVDYVRVYQAP